MKNRRINSCDRLAMDARGQRESIRCNTGMRDRRDAPGCENIRVIPTADGVVLPDIYV